MSDWILGLKKAAAGWMPGVSAEEIRRVEERVGEELPEELRALYRQLDGATFENGVALFPLKGRGQGELGHGAPGLPEKGLWQFGVRGAGGEPLFAARKSALAVSAPSAQHREWFDALPGGTWVFGLRDEAGELYVLRSLEQLLAELVPPAETEEFGEQTFVRALRAVGSALDALGDAADKPGPAPGGEALAPASSEPEAEPARAKPAARESAPKRGVEPAKAAAPKRGAKAAKTVAPPRGAKSAKAAAPKRGAKPAKAAAPKRGAKPVKAAAPKRGAKAVKAAAPKRGAKAAGARKPVRAPVKAKPMARPAKAPGRATARKATSRPKPARSSPKRR